MNILLAGRDTTSCTLTFAVYAFAEHPDVLKRLREEVLRVVGPSKRPTYDDIKEMRYLRAVINGLHLARFTQTFYSHVVPRDVETLSCRSCKYEILR